MHLRNAPVTFVKDGQKRSVYYSAEARDLQALGWKQEVSQKVEKIKPAAKSEPEKTQEAPPKIEVEIVSENKEQDEEALPAFEFMTKAELLEFALNRGVELPNNLLKAELIEACKKL